jgi:hypothetical protein
MGKRRWRRRGKEAEARTTTRAEEPGPRIHGVTAVELLRVGNGQDDRFMVSPGRFEHLQASRFDHLQAGRFEHLQAGKGQGCARHDGKVAGAPVRRSVGRKGGRRSAGSAAVELPGGGGQQARRRQ